MAAVLASCHNFTGTDGINPDGDLTYTNNTLYGLDIVWRWQREGTVFAMGVGGYAFGGLGMTNVFSGSVANGGLFWTNIPTWLNVPPSLPNTYQVAAALPSCDRVIASRLIMTLWGGTPDYTCQLTVNINGTNLPAPIRSCSGSTSDFNAIFSADAPLRLRFGLWRLAGGAACDRRNASTPTVHPTRSA